MFPFNVNPEMKQLYIRIYSTGSMLLMMVTATIFSCNDFLETDPPRTETVSKTVFGSDGAANAAIAGVYSLMMSDASFTSGGLEEYAGIASDELVSFATRIDQLQFYQNSLTSKNGYVLSVFWAAAYKYINNVNAIIEGIEASSGMTTEAKHRIEGEARFIRAFCHFYLVNLFGDVPYLKSSDYQTTSTAMRMNVGEVYTNIETDLLKAHALLPNGYSSAQGERVVPSKAAAAALLARVYLYQGQWEKAVVMATEVISNSTLFKLLPDPDGVFLANSDEAIWQLRPVMPGANTPQGQLFIIRTAPNAFSTRVSLTDALFDSFEPGDLRKAKWVATFSCGSGSWNYINKYRITGYTTAISEYSMVLRLAEQYLIRAEARAHLLDLDGAREDVDAIRLRAGLGNIPELDQSALLQIIERERRAELFGEYGHRWLDLKRTGRSDTVLGPVKAQWQSTDVLFPVPESERLLNPNLSQNPGY